MPEPESLVERKQRRARGRIIDAADELFTSRGFDGVSVSDIAERAEVGRTTFFRHFGDKQEVVFAREHEVLALVQAEHVDKPGPTPDSLIEALRAVEPVVLRITTQMAADTKGFRRHMQLVAAHAELRDRDAAKLQIIADHLAAMLRTRGWDGFVAELAAQIAIGCFVTARKTTSGPDALLHATRQAFDHVFEAGASRSRRS